jgi:O-6-methylguanine DNA methyltransferase
MNTREEVYKIVKMIPKGKVSTYKVVAEMSGTKNPRTIGFYLHTNPSPGEIPCHRVVNSQGKLSGTFAFGGLDAQRILLEEEGVVVKDGKVNLKEYLWN